MGTMASLIHPIAHGGDRLLAHAAVILIRGYQRWISPLKGYCCAHNVLHRRGTCSHFGLSAISKSGLVRGLGDLRIRLSDCRDAARHLHMAAQEEADENGETKKSNRPGWCETLPAGCEMPSCGGGAGKTGAAAGAGSAGGASECLGIGAIGDCGGFGSCL